MTDPTGSVMVWSQQMVAFSGAEPVPTSAENALE
jgi:hypothetical protein